MTAEDRIAFLSCQRKPFRWPARLEIGILSYMDESTFVARLRRVVAERGLKPARLALDAGLDGSTIRKLLSGDAKEPRWDTVEKVCRALGTTPEEFLADERAQAEERNILRLLSELPVPLRRQVVGYAEALRESHRMERREDDEDGR